MCLTLLGVALVFRYLMIPPFVSLILFCHIWSFRLDNKKSMHMLIRAKVETLWRTRAKVAGGKNKMTMLG